MATTEESKMEKLIGTYKGNGFFDLNPVYDELVQYNFEKDEFFTSASDDDEIDYDAMYANPAFQIDLKKYNANNTNDLS